MTVEQKNAAAEERRQADLVEATKTLQKYQDARIYGSVSFHLQSGRIVRAEILTSEKVGG